MNNLELWVLFGLFASIVASTYDMPLRLSKLFFSLILGMIGAVVGGLVAYFIYGIEISGINIAFISVAITGSVAVLLLRRPILKLYKDLKGGDEHAGWNI